MELPEVGTLFHSKYRLDEVLGAGGFATVYRATDVAAERVVAIKILTPDATGYSRATSSRFEREVQVVAQLRDPHTVTMFDFGQSADGLLFMVFEYVPGEDLLQLIEREGRLEPDVVRHILTQVLQSLREAHAHGLLHRDIKPANIRIYEYMGDPYRVKVLDFGIARAATTDQLAQITAKGELVGTPRYMSPEQLFGGDLTSATDVYSLGVVAFEMLMGSEAMHGSRLSDQLARLQTGHVFSIPELERIGLGFSQVLDRMAARDPNIRYRSADQALDALRAIGASGSQSAPLRGATSGTMLPPTTGPQPIPRTPPGPLPSIRVDSGNYDRRVPAPGPYTTFAGDSATTRRPVHPLAVPAAVAAVLVLCIVGLSAYLWQTARQPEAEPAPLTTALREVPIVKSGDLVVTPLAPAAEPEEPPPADAGPAAPPGSRSPGCGLEPRVSGFGDLAIVNGLSETTWPAYVPRNYDPERAYPLIIMLHESAETADQFIVYSGLPKLAEEHGFLIVAPPDRATPVNAWANPADIHVLKRVMEDAFDHFCVDTTRVFVVSHGAGGKLAERVACEAPEIRAIATASYRGEPALGEGCVPEKPIPYLQLSPLEDGYNPVPGGRGCSGAIKISLADHEKRWHDRNHCKGKRRTVHRENGSTCYSWDCEAPFVACQLDGGRGWKGTPVRSTDIHNCDGTPPDFDSARMIWSFFETNSANE